MSQISAPPANPAAPATSPVTPAPSANPPAPTTTATPAATAAAGDRPAWLPEKFKTPEDFAKSYAELEKKLGGKPAAPAQPSGDTGLTAPPAFSDDDGVDKILGLAGLKIEDTTAAWTKDGKLTDEQYARLKAVDPKLTKAVVNQTIRGMIADQMTAQQNAAAAEEFKQTARQRAFELAGGETQFANLIAFKNTLPPERVAHFNKQLEGGDTYEGAITLLMREHAVAVGAGKAQPLVQGVPGTGGGGAPFASHEEYKTATLAAAAKHGNDPFKDAEYARRALATPAHIRRGQGR